MAFGSSFAVQFAIGAVLKVFCSLSLTCETELRPTAQIDERKCSVNARPQENKQNQIKIKQISLAVYRHNHGCMLNERMNERTAFPMKHFGLKIDLQLQGTPSMRFAKQPHHRQHKTVDVSMDLIVKCKCKSGNHTRASDNKEEEKKNLRETVTHNKRKR